MAWLHKRRKITPEMLSEPEAAKFIEEMTSGFNAAVDKSIRQVPIDDISRRRLHESNYIFSGIKTFHELNEAFPSMFDSEGNIKPFEHFLKDVQKINNTYNGSYLRTEYNFARNSSLMAAKWKEFEADGDRYNLQYRTAGDERVRASHAKLQGITLPISSRFWDSYMPPNGYGCRCDVVQVRKGKYPLSDEQEALNLASQATAGKHQEMMRFNPGKEMTTFPAYNAYTRSKCKNCKNRPGNISLAADIPNNELCAACKVVRENAEMLPIKTEHGKVRMHIKHGIKEAKENIEIATYLANKYGYEIDLLEDVPNVKTADSYNYTLKIMQEYKRSDASTLSAIDDLIRKGKKQANNLVIELKNTEYINSMGVTVRNRVRRCENIQAITFIINGKDITYTRDQLVSEHFKIQLADLK